MKNKNEYYRERVDFGKIIGYDVHPGTGEKKPTSSGIIHHFADKRYYVIPAKPSVWEEFDLDYLKLAAKRALNGETISSLRAITVFFDKRNKGFMMNFYFQGKLNLKDLNKAACIGSETIAAFPEGFGIEEHFVRLDAPAKIIAQDATYWGMVYQKDER